MSKMVASFAAGALLVSALNQTEIPRPPKCEVSKEAKEAMSFQQQTISALNDTLKKSLDNLTQACQK